MSKKAVDKKNKVVAELFKEFTTSLEAEGLLSNGTKELYEIITKQYSEISAKENEEIEIKHRATMDEICPKFIDRYTKLHEKINNLPDKTTVTVKMTLPLAFEIDMEEVYTNIFSDSILDESDIMDGDRDQAFYIKSVKVDKNSNLSKKQIQAVQRAYLDRLVDDNSLCEESLSFFFPDKKPFEDEIKAIKEEYESIEKDVEKTFKSVGIKDEYTGTMCYFEEYYQILMDEKNKSNKKKASKKKGKK